jgi:O-antigen/teichoic acid export membrane protein
VGTYFYVRLARPAITLYVITGAAVVELLLALALIPRFGLVGAAASDAVAYALEAIGMTIAIRKLAGVSIRDLWLPTAEDLAMDFRAVARVLRGRPPRPELTPLPEQR